MATINVNALSQPTADIACELCGEALNEEEVASPRLDDDGKPICDECFHEEYEFVCCLCEEYGFVEDQHNFVVVFDTEEVKPGIYRVLKAPYWCHSYFSAWLYPDALEYVAPLPMPEHDYPCGHLCKTCQDKLGLKLETRCA